MGGVELMRYFKTEEGVIRGVDTDQEPLIEESWVEITKDEADRILSAEEDARLHDRSYEEKRVGEYPPMSEYLDAIVKGDEVQKQKYIDDCLAVKAKYPKPE